MIGNVKGITLKVQRIDLDAVAQGRCATKSFAYLTKPRSTPTTGDPGMSKVR
jgi:hypothetical protein